MKDVLSAEGGPHAPASGKKLVILSLSAVGVVYGDIGTSPLYALRECFHGAHSVAFTPDNVLGILSLIFWSLILIVTIKYLMLVMLADNQGEGGILSLASLATKLQGTVRGRKWILVALGLFGAALLYGDGMITPAISVLSAVEGLTVITPFFSSWVLPITILVILALFYLQRGGTARVGFIFGPVTLVWFLVLIALGLPQIVKAPQVLAAINPAYAFEFFVRNGWTGFLVLGAVVLVVTGGEALYADLGHFGKRPIRFAWFIIVLPALVINYFGQGALLLADPSAAQSPFYRLAPAWALYPIVILATAAAVIASQALITGAFSLTRQAMQLGYSPRLGVEHTSHTVVGQIYIPAVNWALMLACIGLVLGFRSSGNLASTYGVAVTATMSITAILLYVVMLKRWHWNFFLATGICGFFLAIDLCFFGANLIKVPQGGWFTLLVAGMIFLLMTTWKKGRQILAERFAERTVTIEQFIEELKSKPPVRIPGTAIFMCSNRDGVPPALRQNLKHNKVLHQRNIILTVATKEIPHVRYADRIIAEDHGAGFFGITIFFGFMDDPDVPKALRRIKDPDLIYRPKETTFFLGRETLIANANRGMPAWRDNLFAFMAQNARRATVYYDIPPERVIEVGTQVEL